MSKLAHLHRLFSTLIALSLLVHYGGCGGEEAAVSVQVTPGDIDFGIVAAGGPVMESSILIENLTGSTVSLLELGLDSCSQLWITRGDRHRGGHLRS